MVRRSGNRESPDAQNTLGYVSRKRALLTPSVQTTVPSNVEDSTNQSSSYWPFRAVVVKASSLAIRWAKTDKGIIGSRTSGTTKSFDQNDSFFR